jgi:hypothetical protein
MEVTTSALLNYITSYENNKLVKVEIAGLFISDNPMEFDFKHNYVGSYMSDYLQDIRNQCKEFYNESEVMRFVVDNIKKILDDEPFHTVVSDKKSPISYDLVQRFICDIGKIGLVSSDDINRIKEFINIVPNIKIIINPIKQDISKDIIDIINIINCIKSNLGWDGIPIGSKLTMNDPRMATCLRLNRIAKYIIQEIGSDDLLPLVDDTEKSNDVMYDIMTDKKYSVHVYQDDSDIIYASNCTVIKLRIDDKTVAYVNGVHLTNCDKIQFGLMKYAYRKLESYGENLPDSLKDKRELVNNLIVRLKYLVHVYPTESSYKLEDVSLFSDGRILIINLRGSNLSKDVLKSEVDKLVRYNIKSVYDADFIAFRFDNGFGHSYFIVKNRFGSKDVIMTKAEVMSLLMENY